MTHTPSDRIQSGTPRLELVLYVSAASPASMRAVANLRRIMRQYRGSGIGVTICDLTADPEAGDRDQVAFTPTLCKRRPEPPMWFVGDLAQADALIEMLDFYGAPRTHGHRKAHDRHPRV